MDQVQRRSLQDVRLCIVGLGYVGLPLAVEFGRHLPTLGFDIAKSRIAELRQGRDHTREVSAEELAATPQLSFSDDAADLRADPSGSR